MAELLFIYTASCMAMFAVAGLYWIVKRPEEAMEWMFISFFIAVAAGLVIIAAALMPGGPWAVLV